MEFLGQSQIGQFKQKSRALVSSLGLISKGCIKKGRHWESGRRLLVAGLLAKSYQECTFPYDSVDWYLGHVLVRWAKVSLRYLEAALSNKMSAAAARPWNCLVNS